MQFLLLVLLFASPARAALTDAIDCSQPKIVKIYGAGGFQGMGDYQSGILISPEGHILTAYSYVLDTDAIRAVLADGRKFAAKLVGADPRLEIAVLKIDASGLPCFDLAKAVRAEPGTRVLALSNLFGVAMGDEHASVQRGNIAVVTKLAARRGVFETPYRGTVYVLDATVNNPGAAGGALVTRKGELTGMLGKQLRNAANNTWLNYAIPIDELRRSVDDLRGGRSAARPAAPERRPSHWLTPAALGIVLVPDVMEWTPPFVDRVLPGSPAAKAGIRPDDLIVESEGRLVRSCRALMVDFEAIDAEDEVRLTVQRGQELLEFHLRAAPVAANEEGKVRP